MTEPEAATERRTTGLRSSDILVAWHGLFAGACIVAYMLGEVSTDLHRIAGYLVGGLLAARLFASIVAPAKSVWALPWPPSATWLPFRRKLAQDPVRALAGRPPLTPMLGSVILTVAVVVVLSGLIADTWHADDLHEAVVTVALWFVILHVAVVVASHLTKRPITAKSDASKGK